MTASVAPLDLPEGVLLRLAVHEDAWAEDLPPVPDGFDVTVSFASEDAADLHGPALALLGYRGVGVAPGGKPGPGADVLVPRELVEQHPTWWEALRAQSEGAFSLAFGPVVASLGHVLALHVRPVPLQR